MLNNIRLQIHFSNCILIEEFTDIAVFTEGVLREIKTGLNIANMVHYLVHFASRFSQYIIPSSLCEMHLQGIMVVVLVIVDGIYLYSSIPWFPLGTSQRGNWPGLLVVVLGTVHGAFLSSVIFSYHLQEVCFFSASRYGAVLLPSSPGALHDLAKDNELAKLLNAFVQEKSGCRCYCMLCKYNLIS